MKILFFLTIFLSSATTWALPVAPFDALEMSALKSRTFNDDYEFEGIVKLSNCSGSLVIFNGMPVTAKAVVMTNGHCIQKPGGYLDHGEVWINRPISRLMKIFDAQMNLHDVMAHSILFASMTGTDLAFYELSTTYEEIENKTGVKPYLLDSVHPQVNEDIEIISGYWDRGYSCAIHSFIPILKEHIWTWTDSIRYTATCDTIGGTSGSPIIAKGERRVIGVNNTSNEKGELCTINNPCEVSANGDIHSEKGVRYGQQTFNTYSCLTPDFRFDLDLPGCELAVKEEE